MWIILPPLQSLSPGLEASPLQTGLFEIDRPERNEVNGVFRTGKVILSITHILKSPAQDWLKQTIGIPKAFGALETMIKEGEARANEPYHLIVEGQDFRGNLDGEGKLEVRIPADSHQAILCLGEEEEEEMSLRIGNLDPVDEVSGIQERLNNLGFYCGAEDNLMGPMTEAAIALFQAKHGLEQTGQIDEATKRRIEEIQGV